MAMAFVYFQYCDEELKVQSIRRYNVTYENPSLGDQIG
jgi:hypothetical protein